MAAHSLSSNNIKRMAEDQAQAEYEKRMNSYPQRRDNETCEVQPLNHIPEQLQILDNDNDGLSMCLDLLSDRLVAVMHLPVVEGCDKCVVPEACMSTVASQIKHQRERIQQACARLRDILDRLEL